MGSIKSGGDVAGGQGEYNKIFFFRAEDGIRDIGVTGVQTCALPIYVLFKQTTKKF